MLNKIKQNNIKTTTIAINIAITILFQITLILATNNSDAKIIEDLNLTKQYNKNQINSTETFSRLSNNNHTNKINYQKAFLEKAENVTSYPFTKNTTYKVRLRPAISTLISIPESEKIIFFSLGDRLLFNANLDQLLPNILTLNTTRSGFDTNLIIKSDKGKIYNFYLRSLDIESKILPHFTIYIEPTKEESLLAELKLRNTRIHQVKTLKRLNTKYSIKGDKDIAPIYAYDDGKFTYLDFGSNFTSNRFPTVYRLLDDQDTIINNHIKNNIIIIESLSNDGFVLKNGDKHVCIKPKKNLNEVYPNQKSEQEQNNINANDNKKDRNNKE